MAKIISKKQADSMNLEYKIDGSNLRISMDIDLNSMLYHLVHRSNMTEKQVKDEFLNNSEFRKEYIDACMFFGKEQIENELDEFEQIVDFAEKTEARLEKASKPVKKMKMK